MAHQTEGASRPAPGTSLPGLAAAEAAARYLGERPLLGGLAGFCAALLLYGVGRYPKDAYFALAQNPYRVDEKAYFYQDSVLLPLAAHLSQLHRSLPLFQLVAGLTVLAAFVVYGALVRRRHGALPAAAAVAILALHPLMIVQLNWLGSPDGLTLLLAGVVAFAQAPAALLLAAALGVANHPQMLIIAPALGALRLAAGRSRADGWRLAALLAGCALGYGLVRLFLFAAGMVIPFDRIDFMVAHPPAYWLDMKVKELPASVLALYGGLLPALLLCLIYGAPRDRWYYLCFGAVQIGSAAVTFFTWDTTRVFGLLTVASLVHCVARTVELARADGPAARVRLGWGLALALALALALPRAVAWYGQVVAPIGPASLAELLRAALGAAAP